MKTIKAGIIGTGFIGPAHIEALRRLGYVEVIALAEESQARAEEKARQLHIPLAYGDYRDMLRNPEIQAIHNCTPNYLHFQITLDAIHAGKHIISEKPLSMNESESAKLVAAVNKTKLVNAIDFNYRGYPLVQQAKQLIALGELGKIYLVHGSYLQDWLLYPTDYNWRLESNLSGNLRAIADIGSHWCDLIQYVSGLKIVEVFADLKTVIPTRIRPKGIIETFKGSDRNISTRKLTQTMQVDTEDYGAVLLRFDGGQHGVFLVSQVSAGRKNRLWFEIDGSKSSLAWDQENPNELWLGHRDKPNEILPKDPSLLEKKAKPLAHYPGGHPEGYPDGLKNVLENVYQDIRNGTRNGEYPKFIDGHRAMLLNAAILKSYQTKKWVKVRNVKY
ncbi:MAG: Gfo/Idh/MocA family oxidoreductase [bacterium]|nr:Gfo/Idh/MocA family oxidoreductase [bacterium]